VGFLELMSLESSPLCVFCGEKPFLRPGPGNSRLVIRVGSHGVPRRSIRAISAVESMEVGTHHFIWSKVLSPKYDMDAYMATLF
jgi:hypothetical protein